MDVRWRVHACMCPRANICVNNRIKSVNQTEFDPPPPFPNRPKLSQMTGNPKSRNNMCRSGSADRTRSARHVTCGLGVGTREPFKPARATLSYGGSQTPGGFDARDSGDSAGCREQMPDPVTGWRPATAYRSGTGVVAAEVWQFCSFRYISNCKGSPSALTFMIVNVPAGTGQ